MISVLPTNRRTSSIPAADLHRIMRQTEALTAIAVNAMPDFLIEGTTFTQNYRTPASRKGLCGLMAACLEQIISFEADWQIKVFDVQDLHRIFSPNTIKKNRFNHVAAALVGGDHNNPFLLDPTACQFYLSGGLIRQGQKKSSIKWTDPQSTLPEAFMKYGWVELTSTSLTSYLAQTRMESRSKGFGSLPSTSLVLNPHSLFASIPAYIDFNSKWTALKVNDRGLTFGIWLKAEAKKVVETIN